MILGKFSPGRLWSLWDMLKVSAKDYIDLGDRMGGARLTFIIDEYFETDVYGRRTLNDKGIAALRADLESLLAVSKQLSLPVSAALISKRLDDPPQTDRELDILIEAVREELASQLFLFVPAHRAKYYDLILPSMVTTAFPQASREIVWAGNSVAAELYTA